MEKKKKVKKKTLVPKPRKKRRKVNNAKTIINKWKSKGRVRVRWRDNGLFVSTTNLTDIRGTARFPRQESVIKSRNKAIVQDILANFDMEEMKQRHRNTKVVEFSYDASDFSFDSALSTERVKARLRKLMGTDVIRLNDQKYTEALVQKMNEERELEMRKKEQTLAEAEQKRIRKLQLEGILPKEKKRKQNTDKRTKRKDRMSMRENKRNSHEEHSVDVLESDEKDGGNEIQDIKTQVEIIGNQSGKEHAKNKDTPTKDQTGSNREKTINTVSNKENLVLKEVVPANDQVREEKGDEKNVTPPHSGKFRRKETQFVKELRDTETVERLYALAEILVAPVQTDNKDAGSQKEKEVKT